MRAIFTLTAACVLYAVAAYAAPLTDIRATLTVTVQGTAAGGDVRVGLYDEATFPVKDGEALMSVSVPAAEGQTIVTFNALPPGAYALKVFRDANGAATRPSGISNDAAADDFDAAAIVLEPGANATTVHLHP